MNKLGRITEVVAGRPDGLGTRLLTIICARIFAERFGLRLKVLWPSMKDLHYDFGAGLLQRETLAEIFEDGIIFGDQGDVEIVDDTYMQGKRVFSIVGTYGSSWKANSDDLAKKTLGFDVIFYDHPTLLDIEGTSVSEDKLAIKRHWRAFNLNREVLDRFSVWKERVDLGRSVAVHIRRGDMAAMLCASEMQFLKARGIHIVFQRYLPMETALNLLRTKFSEFKSIVICSEDDGPARQISASLSTREVHSSYGLFEPNSNQQALLDLLTLANAAVLISPFVSFYSECAAAVGSCIRFNSGLDLPNLVVELCEVIEESSAANKDTLKALVLIVAWQNMWRLADSPERAALRRRAELLDANLVVELTNSP